MLRFIMVTLVALVTVGETAKSQNIAIQTFALQPAAAEQAKKLESFYKPGAVITKEDSVKIAEFTMVCCDNGTIKIYFPKQSECNCPVLTIYKGSNGEFRTDYVPDGYTHGNQMSYSKRETERQVKYIKEALGYLES